MGVVDYTHPFFLGQEKAGRIKNGALIEPGLSAFLYTIFVCVVRGSPSVVYVFVIKTEKTPVVPL